MMSSEALCKHGRRSRDACPHCMGIGVVEEGEKPHESALYTRAQLTPGDVKAMYVQEFARLTAIVDSLAHQERIPRVRVLLMRGTYDDVYIRISQSPSQLDSARSGVWWHAELSIGLDAAMVTEMVLEALRDTDIFPDRVPT